MRTRFKAYARPELAAWEFYVEKPESLAGKWRSIFANPALPLRLEFGCGKGGFSANLAAKQPNYNYIGVDIKSEMLVLAKRNIERVFEINNKKPENVLICSYNIEKINEILGQNDEAERIYLNFSNPWYKTGHAKHRLTHPRQLALYRGILASNGEIYFKTDDEKLFADSLRYLPMVGYKLLWQTNNLHENEPQWNVRTEHENMFAAQGVNIKAFIAIKCPAQLNYEEISRLRDC